MGTQWRRAANIGGDMVMIAGCRQNVPGFLAGKAAGIQLSLRYAPLESDGTGGCDTLRQCGVQLSEYLGSFGAIARV